LAEEKNASAYDKIRTLLADMRDAYGQAGRRPEFDAEFARFVDQHSRSTALIRRLREVRLI
jgi:DNA-binding FadR family transcriptional regulator